LGRQQFRSTIERNAGGGCKAGSLQQVLIIWQERAIEHAVIPWCEAHGVSVVLTRRSADEFRHRAARRAGACRRFADARKATARQMR